MTHEYIIDKVNEAEEALREVNNYLHYQITICTDENVIDYLLSLYEKIRPVFDDVCEIEIR